MKDILFGLLLGLAFHQVECGSEFDVGLDQQQTTFGQQVDGEAVKVKIAESINTTMKRVFVHRSNDNKPMAVYDRLFKGETILTLRSYLTTLGQDSWLFNNYDPDHSTKQRTSDNVPWVNYRNPTEFNKMLVCKTLVKAITDLTGKKEEWFPYKVTGKVLRRGDHTKVVADSNNTDEFSVLIYLNSKWRKNHYGELYFLDDQKEIMYGVTPRPGRVVIWDSSILRLTRPPSVSQKQGQVLLHITFSKSREQMMTEHDNWVSFWNEKMEAKKTWYLPRYNGSMDDTPMVPNVADHVVANYSTSAGDRLYVFDNLFPIDLLDHMRAHVLKYGTYFYDDSIDSESDNVQWIASLDMPMYLESPYWKIIKAVATYATRSESWFPYDVSTNLIRSADHTRIHLDTSSDTDKEWTFLVYLNPNWTRNDYGETAFFERNSDDTEIVAEVRPRYGRAVIFQGQIPHSARPPSMNFTGARLTFVTKLQPTEFFGRMKNFEQEFRSFKAHSEQIESLDSLSETGNTESYLTKMQSIRDASKKYKTPETIQKVTPREGAGVEATGGDVDGVEGEEVDNEADEAETEGEPEEGEEEQDTVGNTESGLEGKSGVKGEADEEEKKGAEGDTEGLKSQGDFRGFFLEEPRFDDPNPDVNKLTRNFVDIVTGMDKDPARIAKLYKEMKSKDAKIMSEMSEKFPRML